MQIETQGVKNKVSKTQGPEEYLTLFFFLEYLLCFSLGKISSDDSPPRVRQRVEESVADRHLRMEKRQVLSEQNLLHTDLRDPVLLPFGQMIQKNQ
jgi:hypothetical protein